MVTVPINITGGTAKFKSRALSTQTMRNFWPRFIDEPLAKSPFIVEAFPGLKVFGSTAGNADRGMLEHQGVLYQVAGEKLFSFDSAGTATELGDIPGSERCILFGMLASVVIVTDGSVFEWDGATLTVGTDPDFESPNSGAHLNNQALYDGDSGRFSVSDVGDPLAIDGLNFATAESNADDLIRVFTFDQLAYMFGEKTIETWWNSGIGAPPFDRIEQGIIQVGLDALHSVASDDDFLYWLGDDNQVYRAQGSTADVISDQALTKVISELVTTSDAIGWTLNLQGTWLYMLTFPIAGLTWVLPRDGEWFEWSFGAVGSRSLANSYASAFGKHLFGDFQSGNVYELDFDTFTDNGTTIIRTRDTAPLHGGLVGAPGKRIEMNRFELIMEVGVGLLTGQGSDPEIMLSFSDDGANTFGTEMFGKVGKLGEKIFKVEWFVLGSFESRIIRVKTSDPVFFSIHSAAADIEIGI